MQNATPSGSLEGKQAELVLTKFGLADRYSVGVRTVEEWLYRGLIVGSRRGRSLKFDAVDCDRRLLANKSSK